VAVHPATVHVVSVSSSVDIKALLSSVSDVSSRTSVVASPLVNFTLPLSDHSVSSMVEFLACLS